MNQEIHSKENGEQQRVHEIKRLERLVEDCNRCTTNSTSSYHDIYLDTLSEVFEKFAESSPYMPINKVGIWLEEALPRYANKPEKEKEQYKEQIKKWVLKSREAKEKKEEHVQGNDKSIQPSAVKMSTWTKIKRNNDYVLFAELKNALKDSTLLLGRISDYEEEKDEEAEEEAEEETKERNKEQQTEITKEHKTYIRSRSKTNSNTNCKEREEHIEMLNMIRCSLPEREDQSKNGDCKTHSSSSIRLSESTFHTISKQRLSTLMKSSFRKKKHILRHVESEPCNTTDKGEFHQQTDDSQALENDPWCGLTGRLYFNYETHIRKKSSSMFREHWNQRYLVVSLKGIELYSSEKQRDILQERSKACNKIAPLHLIQSIEYVHTKAHSETETEKNATGDSDSTEKIVPKDTFMVLFTKQLKPWIFRASQKEKAKEIVVQIATLVMGDGIEHNSRTVEFYRYLISLGADINGFLLFDRSNKALLRQPMSISTKSIEIIKHYDKVSLLVLAIIQSNKVIQTKNGKVEEGTEQQKNASKKEDQTKSLVFHHSINSVLVDFLVSNNVDISCLLRYNYFCPTMNQLSLLSSEYVLHFLDNYHLSLDALYGNDEKRWSLLMHIVHENKVDVLDQYLDLLLDYYTCEEEKEKENIKRINKKRDRPTGDITTRLNVLSDNQLQALRQKLLYINGDRDNVVSLLLRQNQRNVFPLIDTILTLHKEPLSRETLNRKDSYGDTLLHLAIKSKQSTLAKRFVDWQADLNSIDKHGDSPLSVAFKRNELEIIQYVLQRVEKSSIIRDKKEIDSEQRIYTTTVLGIDLNHREKEYGDTLLSLAIRYRHESIAMQLLRCGASPHLLVQSEKSRTIETIDQIDSIDTISTIDKTKKEKNVSVLELSIRYHMAKLTSDLLQQKIDLSVKDSTSGNSMLVFAIEKGMYRTAYELLEASKGSAIDNLPKCQPQKDIPGTTACTDDQDTCTNRLCYPVTWKINACNNKNKQCGRPKSEGNLDEIHVVESLVISKEYELIFSLLDYDCCIFRLKDDNTSQVLLSLAKQLCNVLLLPEGECSTGDIQVQEQSANGPFSVKSGDTSRYFLEKRVLELIFGCVISQATEGLEKPSSMVAYPCGNITSPPSETRETFLELLEYLIRYPVVQSLSTIFLYALSSSVSAEAANLLSFLLDYQFPSLQQNALTQCILCNNISMTRDIIRYVSDARLEDLFHRMTERTDQYRESPLHYAAALLRIDILEVLLCKQKNISKWNSAGYAPLHYIVSPSSCTSLSIQNITLPISKDHDMFACVALSLFAANQQDIVNSRTEDGLTPLILAMQATCNGCVECLLNQPCIDILAETPKDRKSVFHIAMDLINETDEEKKIDTGVAECISTLLRISSTSPAQPQKCILSYESHPSIADCWLFLSHVGENLCLPSQHHIATEMAALELVSPSHNLPTFNEEKRRARNIKREQDEEESIFIREIMKEIDEQLETDIFNAVSPLLSDIASNWLDKSIGQRRLHMDIAILQQKKRILSEGGDKVLEWEELKMICKDHFIQQSIQEYVNEITKEFQKEKKQIVQEMNNISVSSSPL